MMCQMVEGENLFGKTIKEVIKSFIGSSIVTSIKVSRENFRLFCLVMNI